VTGWSPLWSGGRMKRRAAMLALGLTTAAALGAAVFTSAEAQETKVSLKGKISGGEGLLNQAWVEAADPKNHRYTFRQRSTTVGETAKRLAAYLPKELAIVALGTGATANSKPYVVHVSGGRTTPVMIVVPEGQNIQFVNDDPFNHRLYDKDKVAGGLAADDLKPTTQRVWKPPKAGVYEIRDELFPSVRSYVVVEPGAVAVTYPNTKNEWVFDALAPGDYEIVAFFAGKKTGTPLKFTVKPAPAAQEASEPLAVGGGAKDGKEKEP
jgi:hypothetical protein